MPVLGCGAEMAKLMDVSDNDVAIIEDTIAERLELGISQVQAQRQAVDEALAQLREERSMVMAAIDEQLGKEVDANPEPEPAAEPEPEPVQEPAQDDLQNVEPTAEPESEPAPEPEPVEQKPRTLLSTITAAIDKAYPNLRTKLEDAGLLTIGQTLDEVTTAAAQARASKTGESVEDVKASMMGGVSNSVSAMKSVDANIRRGREALAKALTDKTTVHRAMFRNGLGWVDFEWGSEGEVKANGRTKGAMGISHILEARQRKDGMTEQEAIKLMDGIVQTVAAGREFERKENNSSTRIGVTDSGIIVWMVKRPASNAWIVTGYEVDPDKADAGRATSAFTNFAASRTRNEKGARSEDSIAQNSLQIKRSANGDIQGFFDPVTGQSFLIADNLTEQSAPGVLIHEVGIHMANDGTLEPVFTQAQRLLKLGKGNPWFDGVRARLESAGETSGEEAAAYITETIENDRAAAPASVMKWFNDFKAAIKAWLFKKGVFIKAEDLTAADIAAIARANAKSVAGSAGDGDVSYSKAGDQTTTAAFKKWFGDSKVVDADGKPLVVYHGTSKDFSEFVPSKIGELGPGIYLTTSANEAGSYTGTHDGSSNVMPVYVALSNPLHIKTADELWSRYPDLKHDDELPDMLRRDGFDGIMFERHVQKWEDGKGVVDTLEKQTHIVAFSPAQIKSATGNNGNFDATNPDIRFSKAGPAPAGSWDAPPDSRIDKFLQKFQDGKLDLKRIQQAITKSGKTIAEAFDARLAETLYAGRVATRADRFMKSEAQPLLEAMAKNNVQIDDLSDYLLARHAPERNAQIAKVNDKLPDGGAGTNSKGVLMTTQAANDYIANLSTGKRILYEMLAKKVDAISKGTRELLVAEGLETQETIDNWTGAYKHYVPLFKDEANGESFAPHPIGSGFSVKGGASKRAMGSEAEVTNMLSHLLLQREAAITRAEKNRVGMALYGLALTQPNKDFWTTIKPNMKQAEVEASLTAMGIDPAAYGDMDFAPMIKSISKTTGKVISTPNPLYKNLDNAIVLKVEGKDRVIMFNKNNERAMRLVQNLKNLDGVTGIDGALRVIGKPTRWISSMATQYNPAFGMVNLVRDTSSALTNLSSTKLAGKQVQVIGNVPSAIAGIARGLSGGKPTAMSMLYEQFQEDGGQTGYRDALRDPKERTQQIEKDLKHLADTGKLTPRNAAMAVLNLMDGFNTTLENGTRLAAYKVALDNGMSRPEAARLARELTVDFNRKGSLSTSVGPLYAFFNASVQGTARTVETLKGPTGRKVIAGGLALGVMQALMLVAAGYDDDEIAEFSKARALIIPRGDKKYISIPLPLGLHVLPNTGRVLTELAMSQGKEWDKKLFNAVGEIAGAFNPLGGGNVFTLDGAARTLAPTVIDPLVDLATGKDFSGTPISKATMPGDPRPGYLRGRESTYRAPSGEVYTGIAKALNTLSGGDDFRKGYLSLTPEESRYIVMTIGGGLLREIEKATNASIMSAKGEDVPTRQIPLGSRFAGEVDDAVVQHSRYYKNSDKVAALESELKALAKAGRSDDVDKLIADKPLVTLYRLNDKIKASITKLNKMASENINDKETMKSLDDARTENMRVLNEAVRELERESAKQ